MHEPRGNIIAQSRRDIKIGNLQLVNTKNEPGVLVPRLIVYVKDASRRMRDQFRKAVNRLGIDVERNEDGSMKEVQRLDSRVLDYTKDEYRQACRVSDHKEIWVKVPQVMVRFVPDGTAVYDVAGAPAALDELSKLQCIADCHYAMHVGIPRGSYDEKELPTTDGPRFFGNGKPAPRVPHEVRVKAQVEQRRKADANVKYWSEVANQAQVDEYGCIVEKK